MKNLIIFTLLFISVMVNSGCVTWQACRNKFGGATDTHTTTTVVVKRDTLPPVIRVKTDSFYIAGQIVTLTDTLPCPEKINYHKIIKGSNGKQNVGVEVNVKDNKLTVDCKTDSLLAVITIKDSTIHILTDSLTKVQETKHEVLIDNRSWWQKQPLLFQIGIVAVFIICLIFICGIAFVFIKKKFFS